MCGTRSMKHVRALQEDSAGISEAVRMVAARRAKAEQESVQRRI